MELCCCYGFDISYNNMIVGTHFLSAVTALFLSFKAKYGITNHKNIAHVIDVIFLFLFRSHCTKFWINFFLEKHH